MTPSPAHIHTCLHTHIHVHLDRAGSGHLPSRRKRTSRHLHNAHRSTDIPAVGSLATPSACRQSTYGWPCTPTLPFHAPAAPAVVGPTCRTRPLGRSASVPNLACQRTAAAAGRKLRDAACRRFLSGNPGPGPGFVVSPDTVCR